MKSAVELVANTRQREEQINVCNGNRGPRLPEANDVVEQPKALSGETLTNIIYALYAGSLLFGVWGFVAAIKDDANPFAALLWPGIMGILAIIMNYVKKKMIWPGHFCWKAIFVGKFELFGLVCFGV